MSDAERELLAEAAETLMRFSLKALTVKPALDQPYPDAPETTPWAKFIEPQARRSHDLAIRIRKHLREAPASFSCESAVMRALLDLASEADEIEAALMDETAHRPKPGEVSIGDRIRQALTI